MGSLRLSESLSLGHCGSASLGCSGYRFGSKVDRVYCLEVNSRCRRGFGENVVKRSKGTVVCLSKLCLSPLLRTARPAPSLQSQNSGSWPSSPWLWHSGTTPAKSCMHKYYILPLKYLIAHLISHIYCILLFYNL